MRINRQTNLVRNPKLSVSLVLYKSNPQQVNKVISNICDIDLDTKLYIINNSPTHHYDIISDERITYYTSSKNLGFGSSHNKTIRDTADISDYHLIINPDVYFNEGTIEQIITYIEANRDIGVIMPRILYPDGSCQYLAKLLPSPFDFLIRRFMPVASIQRRLNKKFELRAIEDSMVLDVPFLSGCCLIFRTEVLKKVGGFDENIFMYTEDIDICRRVILAGYRSVFYPKVHVFHDHIRKSFKDISVFWTYLNSGIYYFRKWGWFFDRQRYRLNSQTIRQLKESLQNSRLK